MHTFMSTINRWFSLDQHAQCTSLYFLKGRRGARINKGYDQSYDIIGKKVEYVEDKLNHGNCIVIGVTVRQERGRYLCNFALV